MCAMPLPSLAAISVLTVHVPVDAQGEVLGDLSSRRGRIVSSVTEGDGDQIITGQGNIEPTTSLIESHVSWPFANLN